MSLDDCKNQKLKPKYRSYHNIKIKCMKNEFWLNLPVKDISKSQEFFIKLGFSFKTEYANADMVHLIAGDKGLIINLFTDSTFKNIVRNEVAGADVTEVLFSIGAESRQEVDEWATKAEDAGGEVFAKPAESQGWLYGCAFVDLDGHRWNVLYMDMSKMPK